MKKTSFPIKLLLLLSVWLAGCSTLERVPAVPSQYDSASVEVVGVPDVRYDIFNQSGINELVGHFHELQSGYVRQDNSAAFLSISGGGDNGAFTAGFLNGWTKTGNRPNFRLVTGISTGALIAPFAFLGKDYDVTIQLDNGYEPVVKAIYLDGDKKLALIEHFSGGTAGKYTYVISLQDGKEEQVLDRLKAKEYIQTLNKSGKVIFNK